MDKAVNGLSRLTTKMERTAYINTFLSRIVAVVGNQKIADTHCCTFLSSDSEGSGTSER
jgi:hypothetical protein